MGEGSDIELPPAPGKAVPAMLGAVLWLAWWFGYWGPVAPDEVFSRELRRDGRVVVAREVRCGFRPYASIEVDGQRYRCGGVRCPVRGPVPVVFDPRDPSRCVAQAALDDAPQRVRAWSGVAVAGTAVGVVWFGAALAVYVARVRAKRAFYDSQAWRRYVAIRDGGVEA